MQKDVDKGEMLTRSGPTLDRLVDVLQERRTSGVCAAVCPLISKFKDLPTRPIKSARSFLEEGGKTVGVWPPITSRNKPSG